ncbi:protein of unknown function [Methylococcus capsulatus]|uniref:Uncharacterized protein n=1 Tax=Methylococcus capsulatus TaxID=414 RepID=A0AA35UPH7_METCP|nr:protein of unknown function [Methylococcus capsulatus]
MRADAVEEMAVVGNDDHRAGPLVQHVFQPADGVDVQVVGRFVQQQDIRVGKQRLGQQHAQLPARRHGAHRPVVLLQRNAHTQQQFAGTGFCGIAVIFGKGGLQLRRPHVVVLARVRIGVDRIALGHRRPHLGVPHHHDVQHPLVLEGELILAQLAQTHVEVERNITGGRLQIAAEDFHEGRLAAAVGPDQAITVALAELDGDVFEQRLDAELHGDVGCRDQNDYREKGVRGCGPDRHRPKRKRQALGLRVASRGSLEWDFEAPWALFKRIRISQVRTSRMSGSLFEPLAPVSCDPAQPGPEMNPAGNRAFTLDTREPNDHETNHPAPDHCPHQLRRLRRRQGHRHLRPDLPPGHLDLHGRGRHRPERWRRRIQRL